MKPGPFIARIVKRDGTIVNYDRERITNAILKATASQGKADRQLAETMSARVETALNGAYGAKGSPTVEDIQDMVETVLMENHHTDLARSYIIYRHQQAMARAARQYAFEVSDNIPYKKIYEVLRWNMDHGCESVAGLNRIIARGAYPELVRESDRRYSDEVMGGASLILQALDKIRIVIVAGPSSSGKTTTMIKVSEKLATAGVGFKGINIDHYFFDLEKHPRDEFGDYDYETPEALDLDLINEHLVQLLDGRTVRTPHYDFKTGKRTLNVHEFSLAKDQVLLIDSLHGLYDRMTQSVPAESKFRLYIETLGQVRGMDGNFMRWADNRLLRRMLRDKDHRNQQPLETLTHWHYVRRSELKNIIPFLKNTNCIVNSALPYELPLLKARLIRFIRASIDRYQDDPKRLDAHIRANRVYDFLKPLKSVRDDGCVPNNSLIREFIGGSEYGY